MSSQFPGTPEGRVCLAIVGQAIRDLDANYEGDRISARRYLRGPMIHADLCGVSANWIRRMLIKAEIEI